MSTLADQEDSLQYQGHQQITRPFSAFEQSICLCVLAICGMSVMLPIHGSQLCRVQMSPPQTDDYMLEESRGNLAAPLKQSNRSVNGVSFTRASGDPGLHCIGAHKTPACGLHDVIHLARAVMCGGALIALHRRWMTHSYPQNHNGLWRQTAIQHLSDEESRKLTVKPVFTWKRSEWVSQGWQLEEFNFFKPLWYKNVASFQDCIIVGEKSMVSMQVKEKPLTSIYNDKIKKHNGHFSWCSTSSLSSWCSCSSFDSESRKEAPRPRYAGEFKWSSAIFIFRQSVDPVCLFPALHMYTDPTVNDKISELACWAEQMHANVLQTRDTENEGNAYEMSREG